MVSFRCYDPATGGGGGIHNWYNGLPPAHRAEVDAILELLALEDDLSGIAEVKALRGACEGLTEIKIDFEEERVTTDGDREKVEIHLRILGFDGPAKGEFTLLTGFQKENNNAIYGPYCVSALERKNGVINDGRKAKPCSFP
jgi:hypothetical protein